MAKGKALPASQGDSFHVKFFLDGGDSAAGVTTTTETELVVSGGGAATAKNDFIVPVGCRVEKVFCSATLLANGDIADFRVRRRAAQAGTDDDVIRNAVGGSATDAVRLTATTANEVVFVSYDGSLQDTSVEPTFSTTLSAETAVGFLETEAEFDAGDIMTATYKMGAAGDKISGNCAVVVTLARMD